MVQLRPSATYLRGLRVLLVVLSVVCSVTAVAGLPTIITVPDGTTNHGDPNIICTPTTWIDIFIFYFGNYFAHALTVPAYPGESGIDYVFNAILAVLFPTAGITRGIDAIVRHAAWVGGGELQKAARAGALCMVVRSDGWEPVAGDHIRDAELRIKRPSTTEMFERNKILVSIDSPDWLRKDGWKYWASMHRSGFNFKPRKMHGCHILPAGYSFAPVPHDTLVSDVGVNQSHAAERPKLDFFQNGYAVVKAWISTDRSETSVCSVFNLLQAAASLIQSVYATFTLYNVPGDPISQYGLVSFSLTVAPYAFMSAINLLGALLTPTYPTVYLVGSSIMDEASSRGARFDGAIGRIEETSPITTTVEGIFYNQDALSNRLFFSHAGGSSGVGGEPSASAPGYSFEVIKGTPASQGHLVLHVPPCPKFQRTSHSVLRIPGQAPKPRWIQETLGAMRYILNSIFKLQQIVNQSLGGRPNSPMTVEKYTKNQLTSSRRICTVVGTIPIAIVFALAGVGSTGISLRGSTMAQVIWIVAWFFYGVVIGVATAQVAAMASANPYWRQDTYVTRICRLLVRFPPFAIPAIGGFVVVGKMLLEYGSCVTLS